jgi:ELWxxDGT repeat protein
MRAPLSGIVLVVLGAASASAQTPFLAWDFDPAGSSLMTPFAAAGPRVFVVADRDDIGRELGSSEGTIGTSVALDLTPGPSGSSIGEVVPVDDVFTFALGQRLWRSDGTFGGTYELANVLPNGGPGRSATRPGVALFGVASIPGPGPGLYRTDGTRTGTFAVAPPVGASSASFFGGSRQSVVRYGSGFAAVLSNGGEPGQVWLTDGGSAPATRVTPPGLTCDWIAAAGERLFMTCESAANPGLDGLWVTEGRLSQTRPLHAFPGSLAMPEPPGVDVEGTLWFRAGEPNQLWSSDGTPAGTRPLTSVVSLPPGPQGLTASNGLLYFSAWTLEAGIEPWRTDGTDAGTFVLDVEPGPGSSLTHDVELSGVGLAVAGGIVFQARTSAAGSEPWWSDGTQAGTVALPEIRPGPGSSSPSAFVRALGRAFMTADDGVSGRELWAYDRALADVSLDDVTVAEAEGAARFTVRMQPPLPVPVLVDYATVAGTAQAGADFVAVSGTLTFGPGVVEATLEVPVTSDRRSEPDESFALRLSTAFPIGVSDREGRAVIVDDDRPQVSAAGASGVEAALLVPFPITITTGDGAPTAVAVTVRGMPTPGLAGEGDIPLPGTPLTPVPSVTFPAGSPSGTTLPLAIPILDDAIDEPNETFHVRLDAGRDADVPAPEDVTGVILDDDGVAADPPVEISHGSRLVASLVPPVGSASDVDYYVMRHEPYASYEVVVDGVSGDASPLVLELLFASGSPEQTAEPVGTGNALSLRWGHAYPGQHVRVRSAACGSACGVDDVYRLRAYETTLVAPRFNNNGGQSSVIVLQNRSSATVSGYAYFFQPGGTTDFAQGFQIAPRATAVLDGTSFLEGFSGSLVVTHDAPYGGLAGKVVSLEPSTGFSFDTPLAPRPR